MWTRRTRSHASCTVKSAAPLEPMPRPGTGHVTPRTTVNRRMYRHRRRTVALSQPHRRVYGTLGVWGICGTVARQTAERMFYFLFLYSLHAISRFFFRSRSSDPARPSAPYRGLCTRTVHDFFRLLLPELYT